MVGLSAVGVVVAAYLTWLKWGGHGAAFCEAGTGCDLVQASRYATFIGVPTALWGVALYAAIGILAARFAVAELEGRSLPPPPVETALGALLNHITGGAEAETYQPMNVNFGLMPPLSGPKMKKADRMKLYTDRARAKLAEWLDSVPPHGAAMGRGTISRSEMVEG